MSCPQMHAESVHLGSFVPIRHFQRPVEQAQQNWRQRIGCHKAAEEFCIAREALDRLNGTTRRGRAVA